MTSFQTWKNYSDTPTRDKSGWYDADTGLSYRGTNNTNAVSQKALDARKNAKFLGGKALTGSAKQKEWAEKIRATVISQVSSAEDAQALVTNGLAATSKFWIENRNKSANDFVNFVKKQRALKEAFDSEKCLIQRKIIADEYNAFTSTFGL